MEMVFGAGGAYFKPLPWFLRIKVALDAAKGLAFLHSDPVKVIYRDIKASNILLDAVCRKIHIQRIRCLQSTLLMTLFPLTGLQRKTF